MEALQALGDGVGGLAFSCQAGDVGAGGQGGGVAGAEDQQVSCFNCQADYISRVPGTSAAGWDPTSVSLSGLALAQLAIGVLGVLVITSEYSTGSIQTSLAAVPRRGRFLAAKATVLTAVSLITGEATALTVFLLGQALISGQAPTAAFGQPGVLRAVLGSGLYLAALGLLGVALGTLLRHPAAAIGVLVAVVLVLPGIAAALPARIESNVEEYWPTMAGAQVTAVIHGTHELGPWPGFGLMCLFIAAAMAAAFLLLARRDT